MIRIIQRRKIWLTISGALVALSILAIAIWGLNFGIDFTGGSLLEVEFIGPRPITADIQGAVEDLNLKSITVQPAGEKGIILRFQETSEETHQEILKRLNNLVVDENMDIGESQDTEDENATSTELSENPVKEGEVISGLEELRFDSVGPSIGSELKTKSLNAIALVIIAIVLYIAWVFRKVSKPVASWKYGLTAIIALFHDVIITMGIFALLGELFAIEINTPFVAAILTVLGYSVNDTIVVFDRLRENLPKSEEDFEGTVNISVNQTIKRSINTSATTLVVLLSILFFGGGTIKDFVLALSIGVFIGTYSSIFLASPILVVWERLSKK